jgi:hypothetical protein
MPKDNDSNPPPTDRDAQANGLLETKAAKVIQRAWRNYVESLWFAYLRCVQIQSQLFSCELFNHSLLVKRRLSFKSIFVVIRLAK